MHEQSYGQPFGDLGTQHFLSCLTSDFFCQIPISILGSVIFLEVANLG